MAQPWSHLETKRHPNLTRPWVMTSFSNPASLMTRLIGWSLKMQLELIVLEPELTQKYIFFCLNIKIISLIIKFQVAMVKVKV